MEQIFSSACLTLWHCLDSDHEDDSALISPQTKFPPQNYVSSQNYISPQN